MSTENNSALEARVIQLESRNNQLEIRMAVAESDIKKVTDDITTIKDDTKWLRRAFTGAIISASVVGFIGLVFGLIKFFLIK